MTLIYVVSVLNVVVLIMGLVLVKEQVMASIQLRNGYISVSLISSVL